MKQQILEKYIAFLEKVLTDSAGERTCPGDYLLMGDTDCHLPASNEEKCKICWKNALNEYKKDNQI